LCIAYAQRASNRAKSIRRKKSQNRPFHPSTPLCRPQIAKARPKAASQKDY
jgi:hypothetical protein